MKYSLKDLIDSIEYRNLEILKRLLLKDGRVSAL